MPDNCIRPHDLLQNMHLDSSSGISSGVLGSMSTPGTTDKNVKTPATPEIPAQDGQRTPLHAISHQSELQRKLVAETQYMPRPGTLKLFSPMVDAVTLQSLLRTAVEWGEAMQDFAIRHGQQLNAGQMTLATQMAVRHPDKVHLVFGPLPQPSDPALLNVMKNAGRLGSDITAITFGYGIFIVEDFRHDDHILSHELVHTEQTETLGSLKNFIELYMKQINEYGYKGSGLEHHAYQRQTWPDDTSAPVA
jgi:hypothetical protein